MIMLITVIVPICKYFESKDYIMVNKRKGKKNLNQLGGTLLGSGTYGCVYKAPLECAYRLDLNEIYKNDVMKVTNPHEVDNFTEEEISTFVRMLDPLYMYFIPMEGYHCSLNLKNVNNLTQLAQCPSYVNSPENKKKGFRGYFMKYGGTTLDNYLVKNTVGLKVIWDWIVEGVKGLSLLNTVGIVHDDIKSNNCVIHEGHLKIIDFGLAFLPKYDYVYLNYYNIYPFWYSVYFTDDLGLLYRDYESNARSSIPNYVRGSPNDTIGVIFPLVKANPQTYFDMVIKPNINKLDLYCFFNIFSQILRSVEGQRFNLFNEALLSAILDLIKQNMHIDPKQQIGIRKTFDIIATINRDFNLVPQ
jgi:serine/threonine protein kinase